MTEEVYRGFLLDARTDVAQIATLSLTHPSFSQDYHLTSNHPDGFTGTLEDASVVDFEPCPLDIRWRGEQNDTVQSLRVRIGDVGEIIATEIDNLRADDSMDIRPVARFRLWRDDDYSAPMRVYPALEIRETTRDRRGAVFQATARRINDKGTGERFTNARFPMLRGFQ